MVVVAQPNNKSSPLSQLMWGLVLTALILPDTASSFLQPFAPSSHKRIITKHQSSSFNFRPIRISSATKSRLQNSHGDVNVEDIPDIEQTPEELEYLALAEKLCGERNVPFDCIKNARDLSSVNHSPIKANRVFRTGMVSGSTEKDIKLCNDEIQIRTLIDLRSPTEWKEDANLHKEDVYGDYVTMLWKEARSTHYVSNVHNSKQYGIVEEKGLNAKTKTEKIGKDCKDCEDTVGDDEVTKEGSDSTITDVEVAAEESTKPRKERHFVSLMDEFKYVRGTLSKLGKRDIAKALLKSPGAIVSKRVRTSVKDVFLNEINDGGLPMLNELMLRLGAPGIKYVLEMCADTSRHPIAFYCTAGKDRTGIIAAIILSVVGVPDEDIVEDYSLSANVYAQINDHKAMVGALSQRNLNAKTFLGAPPQVMRDTLARIREEYGSVEGYCDWIGFDEESRERLRKALTE
mmetsp:Transcript_46735/g.69124  ORF Transcript_46735/g.69124 Transcript_46735/m.69124 type:complete len:460 (-) Transcript_46735:94-1473(-)|eukprot:CAMPEP_0195525910 /NCGR_PEP_ID=MMETSP0794_2-20130614/26604_1 /TAXON_ID=515487 /ORGANISM="Stephanopyxis turris, Strain CCMP 815" /LENGTH=459 /DNA_ID=CAMNT_0040656475 /DNA_START=100 /DNA_END=1479 /DNA_ORIENTATION=+